jgi:hypothetical protein
MGILDLPIADFRLGRFKVCKFWHLQVFDLFG